MDRFEPETMTDADLDRALANAVNVEPPPAFLASVRERLADERVQPAWHHSWRAAAALAALAFVVALALRLHRNEAPGNREVVQPPLLAHRSLTEFSSLESERPRDRSTFYQFPGPSALRDASVGSGFPPSLRYGEARRSTRRERGRTSIGTEILIDPREADGLRALLAIAGRDDLELALSMPPAQPSTELQPPADIVIAPVTIPPLDSEPRQGERQ